MWLSGVHGSWTSACLNALQFVQRHFVLDVPRVQSCAWFEQKDPSFLVSDGTVFHSARHHDELAFTQMHRLVAELNTKFPLHHEEHLVFILVMMPDEFALELVELH